MRVDISGHQDKAAVAYAQRVAEATHRAQAAEMFSPPVSEAKRTYPLRSRPWIEPGKRDFASKLRIAEFALRASIPCNLTESGD
jgi:hypothetical protein